MLEKTIIIVTLLLAYLLSLSTARGQDGKVPPGSQKEKNLVTNPGFEIVNEDGKPEGWSLPSIWSIDNTHAHSGKRSLTVINNDPSVYVFPSQRIPCKPGEMYDVSLWVKTKDVKNAGRKPGAGLGATVCIEWADKDGKWMGGFYEIHGLLGTQDWQRVGAKGIAIPKDANRVSVVAYMREGLIGQAWFDDLTVTKYRKPLMTTFLLKPSYRGYILPPLNPNERMPMAAVEIKLHLEDHGKTRDDVVLRGKLIDVKQNKVLWDRKILLPEKEVFSWAFDVSKLPKGTFKFVVTLIDITTDKALISEEHTLRKFDMNELPNAYIDNNGTLHLDGKPFFPIGWYCSGAASSKTALKELEEFAASPFNTIMNYGINYGGIEKIKAYLDRAHELGVKVIYSTKDFYEGSSYYPRQVGPFKGEEEMLRGVVSTFKDHPALLAWYLNDELPPRFLPRLIHHYEVTKELDPNHPTWIVHYYSSAKQLAPYVKTTDVMGVDPYPIPTRPVTYVSQVADAAMEASSYSRALWLVPQAFAHYSYVNEVRSGTRKPNEDELRTKRPPTREEVRCMTYLALNHGAKGLIYYSYYDIKKLPDYKERWAWMQEIAKEVLRLSPVILEGQWPELAKVEALPSEMDTMLLSHAGKFYLFAVNTKSEPVNPTFKITGEKILKVTRFFTGDSVKSGGNAFSDRLDPFGVEVYVCE